MPAIGAAAPLRVASRLPAWPRSARQAHAHAVLVALTLWSVLAVAFAAGAGNRSVLGTIKGPDFLQFYTIGHLVRTHQPEKLYDIRALHRTQVALVPESDAELYPPVYPPQVGLLFAPLSALPYRGALLVWGLLTIAAYALVVRDAWRDVERSLPDGRFVFAAAACFPPFWNLVLWGQATVVPLLAFWLAYKALQRDARVLAGCAFGLLLIKPQFAILVAVVTIACGEWRIIAGGIASVAAQTAVVVLCLGRSVIASYGSFLLAAAPYADLLEPKPYQSHSLRALTRLMPAWAGPPLWLGVSAVIALLCIRVWNAGGSWRVRMGVLMLGSVLVNPHLIVYDATVLALPLLWIGAYLADVAPPDRARGYWIAVYWLFVTLLAPTAAVISIQASVLLMLGIFFMAERTRLRACGASARQA